MLFSGFGRFPPGRLGHFILPMCCSSCGWGWERADSEAVPTPSRWTVSDKKGTIMNIHHGPSAFFSLVGLWIMGYPSVPSEWLAARLRRSGNHSHCRGCFFLLSPPRPRFRLKGSGNSWATWERLRPTPFRPPDAHGFPCCGTQFALMFLSVTFLTEAKHLGIFRRA